MDKYYRITAYHKEEDITAIFDSNGYFDALWEFSLFLKQKGFTIMSVGKDENFTFGDMPAIPKNTEKFYCRALQKERIIRGRNVIIVNNMRYEEK